MIRPAWFILLIGLVFCQSADVKKLIRDVQNGDTQKARDYVATFDPASLTSADILYLTGLLESDPDKCIEYYRKIVSEHPDDPLVDDSMMKLGEYYYVSGLYVQAANWFKKVVDDHQDYEDIRRSAKLLLKSLNIAGETGLVKEYTQKFMAEIPDLWDENIQLKAPARPVKYTVQPPEESRGYYLQVGAFSQIDGANARMDWLVKNGYTAKIEPGSSGGKSLNLVLIGGFSTRDEAEKIKDRLNKELNLDSFIIQK